MIKRSHRNLIGGALAIGAFMLVSFITDGSYEGVVGLVIGVVLTVALGVLWLLTEDESDEEVSNVA